MDERVVFLSFWFWPTKAKSDFLLALLRDNPTLISKKKNKEERDRNSTKAKASVRRQWDSSLGSGAEDQSSLGRLPFVAREPQWDLVFGKRLYSQYCQHRDPISVKDALWLCGACSQGIMTWNWKLGLSTLPQLRKVVWSFGR